MKFGDRLKSLREYEGLSREELANYLKISYSAISKYETNVRFPDQEMLKAISDLFQVSTDYLLGKSDTKNPYKEDDLPDDFATPEEAMDFLLNKNVIMGFTGFDIHKLTDEEKTQYARDLLDHLKLLSLKYKK